ncbi:hypothetical protein ANCCAN_17798 [Ancylostoma caninum]|uniref:Uncharacterized protein n=1 Tax=Ancylostoma caninum TaxID=29170 RepID=A0A368FZZ1_ANCCA|nr:hypothetical protein ANCCAN_17798 [Ancylostoma caninum]
MRVVVVNFFLWLPLIGCSWIFAGIPSRELEEARDIGRKAKVEFLNKVVGEADHLKRLVGWLSRLFWFFSSF